MVEDDFPIVASIRRRHFSRQELVEMTTWLVEQTGNCEFWNDCQLRSCNGDSVFYFKDPKLAVHFKIRWDSGHER